MICLTVGTTVRATIMENESTTSDLQGEKNKKNMDLVLIFNNATAQINCVSINKQILY